MKRGVVFLIILCAPAMAFAQQPLFPRKPAESTFYLDTVGVLNTNDAAEINKLGSQVLRDKQYPILVVVIQSRKAMQANHLTIQQYARMLFDKWGIGNAANNRGMLLLVSTTDREARIELGADWAGTVNHESDSVMNNRIVPQFKNGDYSKGLVEGARGMRDIAFRKNTSSAPTYRTDSGIQYDHNGDVYFPGQTYRSDNSDFVLMAFIGLGLIVVISVVAGIAGWTGSGYNRRRRRGYWDYDNDDSWWDNNDHYYHHHHHHNNWGGFGGGGFGGGGGSSGGSFGGGSGGGGGSTGNW